MLYHWSMTVTPSPPGRELGKQHRVRAELDDLIATMAAGEPLPAERDLASRLGVARMTLRRAVDALVDEHRLVRRHGSGTFVAPAAATVGQRLSATSFSADMRARGMRPGGHSLAAYEAPAGVVLSAVLDVPPSSPVLHVRRLRTADDVPMALEDLHVPVDVAPGLAGADLEGASFYQLLEQRYGTPVVSGTQTAEPTVVSAADAALLEVPTDSPAFCFERTSRRGDGRVVEYVRSLYRGDRYRIVVDIFPPGLDRPGPPRP